MGIYSIIDNLKNTTLFFYIFIMVLVLFLYKNVTIGLNVILAIAIGLTIIIYLYDKKETLKDQKEDEMETKIENINPEPKKFSDKDDLVDFFFSIQDFYHYNPLAYEEVIDNVNAFFYIYEWVFKDVKYCDYYYQIADSKKNNAINALHSMIYNLPNNKELVDKFNRAHKRLETIMNDYLNQIYSKCHEKIVKFGRDVNNRMIYLGPKPHNHYDDKDFTYEFY